MTLYLLSIVLAIVAIPLLLGKGDFFFSGYAMMTESEKQQYRQKHDVKKIYRSTGLVMLIVAAILAATTTEQANLAYAFYAVAGLIFVLLIINLARK